jgi:hypothetical protein
MLRLIGLAIKISLFAIVVLVLGHYVRWNGRTVSDQVKSQLSHAERTDWAEKVREVSDRITTPKSSAERAPNRAPKASVSNADESKLDEEIASSERQKLKALIQELNRTK